MGGGASALPMFEQKQCGGEKTMNEKKRRKVLKVLKGRVVNGIAVTFVVITPEYS